MNIKSILNNIIYKKYKKFYKATDSEKSIANKIWYFYFEKYISDPSSYATAVQNANESVALLGITSIKECRGKVYIVLQRPGVLIGVKGININNLEKYLCKEKVAHKIVIIEDNLQYHLSHSLCDEEY